MYAEGGRSRSGRFPRVLVSYGGPPAPAASAAQYAALGRR
jgi:hypothetical protein